MPCDVDDDELDLDSIGLEAAYILDLFDDDSVLLPAEEAETEQADILSLSKPSTMGPVPDDQEYPTDFSLQLEQD